MREKAAFQAHIEWGYSLKDIAAALGVHYSTVSRMVRRRESQMHHRKT
ncbi:helix-turn-helix domain-containing protein [Trichloromonas sp.]